MADYCYFGSCLANCPGWVIALFVLGVIALYVLIAVLVYYIIKSIDDKIDVGLIIAMAVLWIITIPIALVMCVMWYLARLLIIMPLFGATTEDLAKTENKLYDAIDEDSRTSVDSTGANTNSLDIFDDESDDESDEDLNSWESSVKSFTPPKLFKVGDLITGVKGNPDGYQHLYEGCVCRVLSIDEKGSMQLLLIGHKDKEAHADCFGKVYKGPSRNFKLLKAASKKRKTKSSKSRKSRR